VDEELGGPAVDSAPATVNEAVAQPTDQVPSDASPVERSPAEVSPAKESPAGEFSAAPSTVRWQHRKQLSDPATDNDAVSIADEDEAFYERRYRTRRPNRVVRFLKLASPSLVALPIIIAIWSMSGFDFSWTSPQSDSGPVVANAANSASTVADALPPEQSSANDEAVAMPRDQAAEPFVPAEENVTPRSNGSETVARDESTSQPSDVASSENGELDWLLRDLKSDVLESDVPTVDATGSEFADASESKPAKTVLMRAREQLAERQNDQSAPQSQIELPPSDPPVMRFPSEIPPVSEIIQASAESEEIKPTLQAAEAETAAAELPEAELAAAELAAAETADEAEDSAVEVSSVGEPDAASMPATNDLVDVQPQQQEPSPELPQVSPAPSPQSPQEPPELVVACENALRVLRELPSNDDRTRQATLARLTAFREISQIGDHSFSADSPAVANVLDRLVESSRVESGDLAALGELCGAWIGWNKRTTEGMLLIARVAESDEQWSLQLSDGTRLQIEPPAHRLAIPRSGRVVAVAKIVSVDQPTTVKLLAYRTLPGR
jgi:hypothetical protein